MDGCIFSFSKQNPTNKPHSNPFPEPTSLACHRFIQVARVEEFQATMEGQLAMALENQEAADDALAMTVADARELEERLEEIAAAAAESQ